MTDIFWQILPKDERVLLFVQFADLTKKVGEALTAQIWSTLRSEAPHSNNLKYSKTSKTRNQRPGFCSWTLEMRCQRRCVPTYRLLLLLIAIQGTWPSQTMQFSFTSAWQRISSNIHKLRHKPSDAFEDSDRSRLQTSIALSLGILSMRIYTKGVVKHWDLSQKVQSTRRLLSDKAKLNTTSSQLRLTVTRWWLMILIDDCID